MKLLAKMGSMANMLRVRHNLGTFPSAKVSSICYSSPDSTKTSSLSFTLYSPPGTSTNFSSTIWYTVFQIPSESIARLPCHRRIDSAAYHHIITFVTVVRPWSLGPPSTGRGNGQTSHHAQRRLVAALAEHDLDASTSTVINRCDEQVDCTKGLDCATEECV